jgi:hypothetical protein
MQAVDSRAQMPETLDEVSAPLGLNTAARKRRVRLPFTAMQALALLLGLSLVVFVGVASFNKHSLGSEPTTSIVIPEPKLVDKLSATTTTSSVDEIGAAPKQAAPGQHKTVTIIDGSSGARQEVVIGSGDNTNRRSRISPKSR